MNIVSLQHRLIQGAAVRCAQHVTWSKVVPTQSGTYRIGPTSIARIASGINQNHIRFLAASHSSAGNWLIIWMILLDQFVLIREPVSIIMHAVIFYLPTSLQRAPWQFPSCTVKLQIQACTLHGCKTTLLSWSAKQSQSLPAEIKACQGHHAYVHSVK